MSAPIITAEREDKQPEKIERPETLAEQLAFKSRFVLVFGEINHNVARTVCERLIALSQQSDAPIRMLISSPGGHVESGDAIHDMIRFINAPVMTIGTASCTSDKRNPACSRLMPSTSRRTGRAGGNLPTCKAALTPARMTTREGSGRFIRR